jgi:hypothetical protein
VHAYVYDPETAAAFAWPWINRRLLGNNDAAMMAKKALYKVFVGCLQPIHVFQRQLANLARDPPELSLFCTCAF